MEWYDDEPHIGYDQMGQKIAKPKKKTEIDTFLEKMEDPDYWYVCCSVGSRKCFRKKRKKTDSEMLS